MEQCKIADDLNPDPTYYAANEDNYIANIQHKVGQLVQEGAEEITLTVGVVN